MNARPSALIAGMCAAGLAWASPALAQTGPQSLADFTQLTLQGVNLNNPTTVNVGADGKLYVTQQNGIIAVLTVNRQFQTVGNVQVETWNTANRYDIDIVQDIPNHDDQGRFQNNINNRQVTGAITAVDDFGNVMLYVTSSDPRISVGNDTNLDTNSGVISRLTQVVDAQGVPILDAQGEPTWERLDLVRGFPRSEENHAINGLELAVDGQGNAYLFVSVGGNTNAGAQGNNFSYTPEYFYSGSIVRVDLGLLDAIEANPGPQIYSPASGENHPFLFDLPTLDDPTRTNDANGDLDGDGFATADVFGGNDGLNQAIFDPSGIVQLYSVGYRNQYDVTIAANGDVYTADNGSNGGWGGVPLNALGQEIVDANNDGLADNGPAVNTKNESGSVNKGDQLHRAGSGLSIPAYDQAVYGGHPNFYRARGAAAGFYLYASGNNNSFGVGNGDPLEIINGQIVAALGPVDVANLISNANLLTGLDANMMPNIDPRQEVFKAPNRQTGILNGPDGSLYSFQSSTNGIDEYVGPGGLTNTLLTVSFNGDITALHLDANGDVDFAEARSLTSNPLDVIAQGPTDLYPNVIFVAAHGSDQIVILSPDMGQGVVPNPNDRDNDGLDDTFDPFPVDPFNGYVDLVRSGDTYLWDFSLGANSMPPNESPSWFDGTGGLYNGGAIGFTGVMTNRQGLPETLTDPNNVIYGGAPGFIQVKAVEEGTPATNTQRNGFQLGLNPVSTITNFDVTTSIDNFLDEIGNLPATAEARQGLFVGAGDQDNYISISLTRRANGDTGFEVESQFAFDFIGATQVQVDWYPITDFANVGAADTVVLGLDVDRSTGMVTPHWTYVLGGQSTSGSGTAVGLTGDAWDALTGVLMLPTDTGNMTPSGFAVGFLSSVSGAGGQTFPADYDDLAVTGFGQGAGALVTAVNAGGPNYTAVDGTLYAEDLFMNGNSFLNTQAIAGTDDDPIYNSERWLQGGFTYDVPVANGSYLVRMHFSENFNGNFGNGLRVFDVELEGNTVLDDLDIFAEVGPSSALVKEAVVSVADGGLTLTTIPVVENPKISGFAIYDFSLDNTAPSVSVNYNPPVVFDDPLRVTVTLTDDQQLAGSSIDLTDVTITGDGQPLELLNSAIVFSGSGGQAFLEYDVRPLGGWFGDTITVDLPAGAFTDAAGNPSPAFNDASFTYSGNTNPVIAAVNVGGPAYTDLSGQAWAADFGFTQSIGNSFSIGRAIAGTGDDTLYQSERFGIFTYEIPVPPGEYIVDLKFAEVFNQINAAGQRVFDVYVEGKVAADDVDIFAAVGAIDTAYDIPVTVNVIDGSLTIKTFAGVQNPKLSAFSATYQGPPTGSDADFAFGDPTIQSLLNTTDDIAGVGTALVKITPNAGNVQASNFGANTFSIENTGTKRIAGVFFDITTAVLKDAVFDPTGTGGDATGKPLTFDTPGGTMPVDPAVAGYQNNWLPARDPSTFDPVLAFDPLLLDSENNLFVDEVSNNNKASPKAGGGFRGELVLFDDFGPGETVSFSADMDPNSIAGLTKASVDASSNPAGVTGNFDVGGISGAELTGSVITVIFGDGTCGIAQLGHDGSQGGAQALVTTNAPANPPTVSLSVGGFAPGDVGIYGVEVPQITVTGTPGDTVRISMVKGLDPVGNTTDTVANGQITIDALVDARLNALYPEFPVNNAVEWQSTDVLIPPSGTVDLTYDVFDYENIAANGGSDDFPGDDVLPLSFVAAVIDANGQPAGPVTEPIELVNQGGPAVCEDRDEDGFTDCDGDCDDLDPLVNPGADEVCDGIDNDCDTFTDGAASIDAINFYQDSDSDGFGNPNVVAIDCAAPPGFVEDDTDCDDLIASINPNGIEICDMLDNDCNGTVDGPDSTDADPFYADTDGDGFGNPDDELFDCAAPSGYVADDTDCDDTASAVNPNADERCNGFDDNCDNIVDDPNSVDAATWYIDGDSDGFGSAAMSQVACTQPAGYVNNNTDCDDVLDFVNPGATEVCNTFDDDCDGTVDGPTASDATLYYQDLDNDLFGNPAVSQRECSAPTGFVANNTDCDDTRGNVNPNGVEVCDDLDNDCNGTIDGPTSVNATTWYADGDSDGFGNPANSQLECDQPSGFVATAGDCDDNAAAVNPNATEVCNGVDDDCDTVVDPTTSVNAPTWFADTDNDTFGDANNTTPACSQPSGFVANSSDCDDTSNAVNPLATEVCDGIDNNCDTLTDDPSSQDATTWYQDSDSDNFGNSAVSEVACAQPTGFVTDATDCDDARAATFPGATEFCNTFDDDCDGTTDEDDAADAATWYADTDSDSYGNASASTQSCSQPTGFVSDATDCDDTASAVNPGATEFCNGIDDNCDTVTDESTAQDAATWYADTDNDTYGDANNTTPACSQPSGFVANAADCDDTAGAVNPGATEFCNGIDDNCDTEIDEATAQDAATWYRDNDSDTFGDANVSEVACNQPTGFVSDNTDCDDGRGTAFPGADEFCNTFDDDCDGITDEDDAVDAGTWFADTDNDLYGDANDATQACAQPSGYVANNTDCDDTRNSVNPLGVELCNGLDDNCDGSTDGADSADASTFYADTDNDTFGDATNAQLACAQPTGFVTDATDCDDSANSVNPNGTEVCNQIDDNCNGTADEGATDAVTWHADTDIDGFGDPNVTLVQCPQPTGYVLDNTDCNDAREDINPGQDEICDPDDIDENCSGEAEEDGALGTTTYYIDDDLDGFGDVNQPIEACQLEDGIADVSGDCNDDDDVVYPGAPEDCTDRRDTNCDGSSGMDDLDEDGFAACDECDDQNADRFPGNEEVCDGLDNDCNMMVDDEATDAPVWYVDADGDGFGSAEVFSCDQPEGTVEVGDDCNDDASSVFPGAVDVEGDEIDQDCDGTDAQGGCGGCSSNGSPSAAWLTLLGLGVLLRRRRR